MKSKFGTTLALTAVLLTGTAAAAINTQALISPTESTLGTTTTTLLPPIDMVSAGTPQPTASAPGAGAATSSGNETPVAQPEADAVPTIAVTPVATPSPKPVYGNPNPSTGDDEGDDGEENDDDGDDD